MKDKILEILLKKLKSSPTAASEIADMVKAFTEWQVCSQRFLPTIDRDIDDSIIEYCFMDYDSCDLKKYSIDELFDYWYDKIREK